MEPYNLKKLLSFEKRVQETAPAPKENNKVQILGTLQSKEENKEAQQIPEEKKAVISSRDDYIAKTLHGMALESGWVPTRTTPEENYYFYTYIPPAHKRQWQQARVYVSKLNANKTITLEGLTIPAGSKDRLHIVIRMQKTGGIDRLMNSKTVTQILDTNNYFNQNSELVNEEGLKAVLSAYLRQAEIL